MEDLHGVLTLVRKQETGQSRIPSFPFRTLWFLCRHTGLKYQSLPVLRNSAGTWPFHLQVISLYIRTSTTKQVLPIAHMELKFFAINFKKGICVVFTTLNLIGTNYSLL